MHAPESSPVSIPILALAFGAWLGFGPLASLTVQAAEPDPGVYAWRELAPLVSPSPRTDHAMAYDGRRSITVLFGGKGVEAINREYDGAARTWTLRARSGPAPRTQMGLAFDGARSRTVLFGGRADGGEDFQYGDTWLWNGRAGTWTQHRGQDVPARLRVGLVYHGGLQTVISLATGEYVEGPLTFATPGRVAAAGGPVTLR
jgi:hypothetical protein